MGSGVTLRRLLVPTLASLMVLASLPVLPAGIAEAATPPASEWTAPVQGIPAPSGSHAPWGIALEGGAIAVAGGGQVSRVDPTSGSPLTAYVAPPGVSIVDVAPASGGLAAVGSSGTGAAADIWIGQFDGSGGLAWSDTFGTSSEDEGVAIASDGTGSLYVTGATGSDVAVRKYTAGTMDWETILDFGFTEIPVDIDVDQSGLFVASNEGTVEYNGVVRRLDPGDGAIVSEFINLTGSSYVSDVGGIDATDRALYVSANTVERTAFGDYHDAFLMKLDPSSLSTIWSEMIGTTWVSGTFDFGSQDWANDVVADGGWIYVVGATDDTAIGDPVAGQPSGGFLRRYVDSGPSASVDATLATAPAQAIAGGAGVLYMIGTDSTGSDTCGVDYLQTSVQGDCFLTRFNGGAPPAPPDPPPPPPPPGNEPPSASLTVSPTAGKAPLTVEFDASGSSDTDGSIVSYTFLPGDGSVIGPQASPTASHTYVAEGSFVPSVEVDDDDGAKDTEVAPTIEVGNRPPVAQVSELNVGPYSMATSGYVRVIDVPFVDPDGDAVSLGVVAGSNTSPHLSGVVSPNGDLEIHVGSATRADCYRPDCTTYEASFEVHATDGELYSEPLTVNITGVATDFSPLWPDDPTPRWTGYAEHWACQEGTSRGCELQYYLRAELQDELPTDSLYPDAPEGATDVTGNRLVPTVLAGTYLDGEDENPECTEEIVEGSALFLHEIPLNAGASVTWDDDPSTRYSFVSIWDPAGRRVDCGGGSWLIEGSSTEVVRQDTGTSPDVLVESRQETTNTVTQFRFWRTHCPEVHSDGDGIDDCTELNRGWDHQNADTDGDNVPDGEDPYPTDPFDGEGPGPAKCTIDWIVELEDGIENPMVQECFKDSDGDGVVDLLDPCPNDSEDRCNEPPPASRAVQCGPMQSKLDTCDLQIGDIVVWRKTGGLFNWVVRDLGNTYWTHAGVVVCDPYLPERPVTQYTCPGDVQVAHSLSKDDPPAIDVISQTDWSGVDVKRAPVAVGYVRPYLPLATRRLAATLIKDKVESEQLSYPGNTVLASNPNCCQDWDGTSFYCSSLVWAGYLQAGEDLADGNDRLPWITPDDLAKRHEGGSVFRRVYPAGVGSGTVTVAGGASLLITDPAGRRSGVDSEGATHDEIPGAIWNRHEPGSLWTTDTPLESVSVDGLDGDWTITISSMSTTAYDIAVSYATATTPSEAVSGLLLGGESTSRLVSDIANHPPDAALTVTHVAGLEFSFDASGSSDRDGAIASYEWDFDGDGITDQAGGTDVVFHTYDASNSPQVVWPSVLAIDDNGGAASAAGPTRVLTTEPLPIPTLTATPSAAVSGASIAFQVAGFGIDDVDDWYWDFGDGTRLVGGSEVSHAYTDPGSYQVIVWDAGNTASAAAAEVEVLVPGPPTANDDTTETLAGLTIGADVLTNDTDPDRNLEEESLLIVTPPANGQAGVTDGTIVYTSSADFEGTDVLVYEVCDQDGQCDNATLTINVERSQIPASDYVVILGRGLDLAGPLIGGDIKVNRDAHGVRSIVGHGTVDDDEGPAIFHVWVVRFGKRYIGILIGNPAEGPLKAIGVRTRSLRDDGDTVEGTTRWLRGTVHFSVTDANAS